MQLVDNDQIVRDRVFGFFIAPTKIINYVGDVDDLGWLNRVPLNNHGYYTYFWITPKDQYEDVVALLNSHTKEYLIYLNEDDHRKLDKIEVALMVWLTNDSAIISFVISSIGDEWEKDLEYNLVDADITNCYKLNTESCVFGVDKKLTEDTQSWVLKELGTIFTDKEY